MSKKTKKISKPKKQASLAKAKAKTPAKAVKAVQVTKPAKTKKAPAVRVSKHSTPLAPTKPRPKSHREVLKHFKKVFEREKSRLLFSNRVVREDFSVNPEDRFDEVDQAATDSEQAMQMRLCNREALYLKKVNEALRRIESGVFGLCDACEEHIEFRRLEARPTANLCLSCKEDQERREGLTAYGRMHKSLGESFSRRTS